MKSEAAAKATAAQSTPSRLPSIANCLTGAPLRMELRLLEFQNRRGELRVFVLFLLTCSLFRRASPHEGYRAPQGATNLPRAAEEILQQRASKAICEGVLWGKSSAACLGLRLGLGHRARSRARARVRVGVRVRDPLGGLLVREVAHQRHDPPLSWRGRCTLSLVVSSGRL